MCSFLVPNPRQLCRVVVAVSHRQGWHVVHGMVRSVGMGCGGGAAFCRAGASAWAGSPTWHIVQPAPDGEIAPLWQPSLQCR